jgi:hypothetical protein
MGFAREDYSCDLTALKIALKNVASGRSNQGKAVALA